jgi:hypothetical protein
LATPPTRNASARLVDGRRTGRLADAPVWPASRAAATHPRRFARVEEHQRRQVTDPVEIDAAEHLVARAEQAALARAIRIE